MTEKDLKRLPLGTSDFLALRMANQIYVDKTEMVFTIASERQKYFFARPRRFGKSLLISTFESLFKSGIKDFRGLAIEKLWKEKKIYQVVRFDFSEIKPLFGLDKFRKDLEDRLIDNFYPSGFRFDPSKTSVLSQLSAWMRIQPTDSLVLLIDEYDAPLTACLDNAQLFEGVRSVLSEFYAVIKANDRIVRFAFITGITKFNKTSIFSELNNLSDLSLDVEYGSLLGYTHSEVEYYFCSYLTRAAALLGLTSKEMLKRLTTHYDGFCFERTATEHVFAPWSLLKFFASPRNGLVDYWFESGGKPSVLVEYLKSHALREPEEYGREKTISLSALSGSSDVEGLSDLGLLTQAGYLTIKSVKYGDTVFLDYPNLEVRRAMAQLYLERLLSGKVAGQVGAGPIVRVLCKDSSEEVFHILNRLFQAIDYKSYPVKDEASVRAYVQVYFAGAGLEPKVEQHNAFGRSDLEVKASDRYWVFEFKVCHDRDNAVERLQEGIEQLRSRRYGEHLGEHHMRKVVLVFSLKARQFVKWQEIED